MRRTLLPFAILFFLFALSSPLRFAYAAAPQTDPLAGARNAIESVVQSLTPPPLTHPNLRLRSAPTASDAQAPSVIVAASQSALHTLAYALSQAASAWSTWVALANARLIAKVKVASIPASAAVIVAQTGANAPPVATIAASPLPTPHLFPSAGVLSKQSNRTYATADVGVVLGTSTQESYVTQDQLAAQLSELENSLRSLIYQNESAPGSVYSTGGYTNDIALSNRIDNLSGSSNGPLTISDATFSNVSGLTAAEIPTNIVAANYLPLVGGTLTGALFNTSTSSSYFLGAVGIGTSTPGAPLEISDTAATSTAIIGSNIVSDGSFTSNPSSAWTLGSNWSWDSTNDRAQYTGAGGPIASVSIDNGGTGYLVNDTVTISGGTGDATYSVTSINSSGGVTALTQVSAGTTYTASPSTATATTGGTGSGLTISILQIANGATLIQSLTPTGPTGSYYSVSYDSWISGTTYQVSFTIAVYSGSGQVQVGIGTVSNQTQLPYYFKQNGNFTITLTSSSPTITFTPTEDFVGEITNVAVEPITPSPATMRVTDSNGDSRFEIRSGGVEYNTFLGVDAGRNTNDNVQGYVTAVGYDALFSNINSWNDVAVGAAALYANTTGNSDVAVGESALQYNTTGSNNTAVGFVALGANTTGAYNTAVGLSALNGNTTGSANVAVGASALQSNNTGGENTAVGVAALYLNTFGNQNTGLGWNALYSNTTGSNNTGVGYQALVQNTTGNENSAVGRTSLDDDTTGAANAGLGFDSLLRNTTGSDNVALGADSLQNATTSNNNTAVGLQAMLGGTTGSLTISGSNNVALGLDALEHYIDGSSNTALGYQTMLNATTSKNSVAVGYLAGEGKSTNDSYLGLSALGYESGLNLSNNSNYNTLIGYQAGYNVTTGADNILIGSATSSNANANLTTGSQNILIGENEKFPSATANGQLDIGNILYGTNITGTGSTLSLGNIGIGTTTPWGDFTIQHNYGIANTSLFYIASSTNAAGTKANIFLTVTNTGNIGIGTTTPYAPLTVWGPDAASSTLAFNVVSSASTTVFAVFDGGNAQLSGTLTQSSDERLKTNIQSLDASSSLSLIDELNPVTFNWIDPDQGTTPQLGFIAQQVQQVFPNLVSTTSATALTPGGTLGLNYIGLISPIVSAIQALYTDVESLEQTVSGFAQSFTSNNITADQQICVKNSAGAPICITGDQLAALLAADNQTQSAAQPGPAGGSNPPESVTQNSASTTATIPPTITINGDNPAVIEVGDSYADLGATVSDTGAGQAGDTDLGITTFLNGTLVSNIVIDTSEVATDTIDYVATDTAGLTSTSIRTVIVEATASSNAAATTTDATTTQ